MKLLKNFFRLYVLINIYGFFVFAQEQLDIARIIIVGLISVGSFLLAQGVTLPGEHSQAPIGGLGWLAVLGGALAYKKLRNKK